MEDPKEYWTAKASELKRVGKFEEAVEFLDKVQEVEKEERSDDFWYKKATHYCEVGDFENARDCIKKDIEINEKRFENYFLLGQILFELEDYEESLENYNKAAEVFHSQHLRNTRKIDQMKNVRKFEESVKYSDLVYNEIELDSNFWKSKGMTLLNLRKFNDASSCFKQALEFEKDNTRISYQLAKSELLAGNESESLQILEKICADDPTVAEKLRIDRNFHNLSKDMRFRMLKGFNQI